MKIYLKVLACLYFIGGFAHVLDLLDLRLIFSEMSSVWKIWIVYLVLLDFSAAAGLWQQKSWGVILFLLVAISQLIAYIGFRSYFGNQDSLIVFHLITLALYFIVRMKAGKATLSEPFVSSSQNRT